MATVKEPSLPEEARVVASKAVVQMYEAVSHSGAGARTKMKRAAARAKAEKVRREEAGRAAARERAAATSAEQIRAPATQPGHCLPVVCALKHRV